MREFRVFLRRKQRRSKNALLVLAIPKTFVFCVSFSRFSCVFGGFYGFVSVVYAAKRVKLETVCLATALRVRMFLFLFVFISLIFLENVFGALKSCV